MNKRYPDYDYVIAGAGLFGCTLARRLAEAGHRVLVLEASGQPGGMCREAYDKGTGIQYHKYGPHIFHTDSDEIWNFVTGMCVFRPFELNTLAKVSGLRKNMYSRVPLPFNMYTFREIFGTEDPEEARRIISGEINEYLKGKEKDFIPSNLEEQAISLVGRTVYELLIKEYTEKQWNRKCSGLPGDIIKRLPVRYEFNNNYFNDRYQGIPINYNTLINNMLNHNNIDLLVNEKVTLDMFYDTDDKVIYSGPVDGLCKYIMGHLEYRSLSFELYTVNTRYFLKSPIENSCVLSDNFTRTVEYKRFHPENKALQNKPYTLIAREYPEEYIPGISDPYYSINNEKNNTLYDRYKEYIHEKAPGIILGGRLGSYKYMDMDDTIQDAFDKADMLLKNA